LKKHSDRPALRAYDVARWIANGILEVSRVRGERILILINAKSVRQTWLQKTKSGQIRKRTAVTYLRKGIFLVPMWYEVPDWEIEILKKSGITVEQANPLLIIHLKDKYLRLGFMQDEDLDHALRQQNHVLDTYFTKTDKLLKDNFPALSEALTSEQRIVDKIEIRRIAVRAQLIPLLQQSFDLINDRCHQFLPMLPYLR
jgi:hypothetical protein